MHEAWAWCEMRTDTNLFFVSFIYVSPFRTSLCAQITCCAASFPNKPPNEDRWYQSMLSTTMDTRQITDEYFFVDTDQRTTDWLGLNFCKVSETSMMPILDFFSPCAMNAVSWCKIMIFREFCTKQNTQSSIHGVKKNNIINGINSTVQCECCDSMWVAHVLPRSSLTFQINVFSSFRFFNR